MALLSATATTQMLGLWDGLGWDARAYYLAWEGQPYSRLPGMQNSFNYSPIFAQLVWPLTFLPWPVFCALFVGSAGIAAIWLVWGLPLWQVAMLLGVSSTLVASGNIDWLFAVMAVVGIERGGPWAVIAFTKITPCLGPLWFALRGDWAALRSFVLWTSGVLAVSVALAPGLWREWMFFLVESAGGKAGMFLEITPPLWMRLIGAVLIVVVAARRSRPSWLPAAMLLAVPVPGTGPWILLLAIPRLRAYERRVGMRPQEADVAPADAHVAKPDSVGADQ